MDKIEGLISEYRSALKVLAHIENDLERERIIRVIKDQFITDIIDLIEQHRDAERSRGFVDSYWADQR